MNYADKKEIEKMFDFSSLAFNADLKQTLVEAVKEANDSKKPQSVFCYPKSLYENLLNPNNFLIYDFRPQNLPGDELEKLPEARTELLTVFPAPVDYETVFDERTGITTEILGKETIRISADSKATYGRELLRKIYQNGSHPIAGQFADSDNFVILRVNKTASDNPGNFEQDKAIRILEIEQEFNEHFKHINIFPADSENDLHVQKIRHLIDELLRIYGMLGGLKDGEQIEIASLNKPLDMIIYCPQCGKQHIDAPEPENNWTNPPHKIHLCHFCRCLFKVANVPTNGVESLAFIKENSPPEKPKLSRDEINIMFDNFIYLNHPRIPITKTRDLIVDFCLTVLADAGEKVELESKPNRAEDFRPAIEKAAREYIKHTPTHKTIDSVNHLTDFVFSLFNQFVKDDLKPEREADNFAGQTAKEKPCPNCGKNIWKVAIQDLFSIDGETVFCSRECYEKKNENQTADADRMNKFNFAFIQTADLLAIKQFLVLQNNFVLFGLPPIENKLLKIIESELIKRGEYAAKPFLNELIKLNSETKEFKFYDKAAETDKHELPRAYFVGENDPIKRNPASFPMPIIEKVKTENEREREKRFEFCFNEKCGNAILGEVFTYCEKRFCSELCRSIYEKQFADECFNDADEDLLNAQKSLIESRPEIHNKAFLKVSSVMNETYFYHNENLADFVTDFAIEQIAEFCGFELPGEPETEPADDQKTQNKENRTAEIWQYKENCSDCGKELNPDYAVIPNDAADERFFCSVECLNHLFDLKPADAADDVFCSGCGDLIGKKNELTDVRPLWCSTACKNNNPKPADAPDADGTNALLNKSKE